jgi:DNA-binding transcriptional regulator YdaS (Cro superfamily)
MKLTDWFMRTGTRRVAFARDLGVSPAIVTYWCNGKRAPRAHHAFLIERETGGAVTARSFWMKACSPRDWRCRVRREMYLAGKDTAWLASRLKLPYSTTAAALDPKRRCSIYLARRIVRIMRLDREIKLDAVR